MWYNESHRGRCLQSLERGERFLGNSDVPGKELRIYLQTVMIVDLRSVETIGLTPKAADQCDEDSDKEVD